MNTIALNGLLFPASGLRYADGGMHMACLCVRDRWLVLMLQYCLVTFTFCVVFSFKALGFATLQ